MRSEGKFSWNDATRTSWEKIFAHYGRTFHHSPRYFEARESFQTCVAFEARSAGADRVITAFALSSEQAECVFDVAPSLGQRVPHPSEWSDLLEHVRSLMGVHTVRFPMLYRDEPATRALLDVDNVAQLDRLSSPAVRWNPTIVRQRIEARAGRSGARRARAFSRKGLTFGWLGPREACAALEEIESRSWKAQCGQDMSARGQLGLYQQLLRNELTRLFSANAAGRPIAYRLDARVGDRVFAVKWSYNDQYRGASPGFNLLTEGLLRAYPENDLVEVDLFGSPDTLKDLLESHRYPRVTVVWPAGAEADRYLEERRRHDQRVSQAYDGNRSIRTIYEHSTESIS